MGKNKNEVIWNLALKLNEAYEGTTPKQLIREAKKEVQDLIAYKQELHANTMVQIVSEGMQWEYRCAICKEERENDIHNPALANHHAYKETLRESSSKRKAAAPVVPAQSREEAAAQERTQALAPVLALHQPFTELNGAVYCKVCFTNEGYDGAFRVLWPCPTAVACGIEST